MLNNATGRTQETQLGGIILGNPNLKGGAANIILNEVNGGSASQLRGYTEVAGQSAKVIVANPYGVTCNGCGFINTPNVTLTTGKPVIVANPYGVTCNGCGFINTPNVTLTTGKPILDNGRLDRYQVDGGAVTIDGQGLNADNVDRFEIITRSAKINAQINARNLTVIAGRNDVNAQTLAATARADDGSAKPELAIDSSALGGMYAGAIRLLGTEAGVGVKLDGSLIASGGDIQLDANGQLKMAQAKTENGAINIKAAGVQTQGAVHAATTLAVQSAGDLHNQNNLSARDRITLISGGQLTNSGIVEAGVNLDLSRNTNGDLKLSAQTINNSGSSLVASRNLDVSAAQTLNNQGGTLSAKQLVTINAGTLDNQNKGRVLSTDSLDLKADQVLNTTGLVASDGALSANVGQLNNRNGELSSLGLASLQVATLDNVAGLVSAGHSLTLNATAHINNQGGRLTANQAVSVNAGSLDNSQKGLLTSQGTLGITLSGTLANQQQGRIEAIGSTGISVGALDNQQGGVLTSSQALELNAGAVNNREGGAITSAGTLRAHVTSLDQHDQGRIYSNSDLSLDLSNGHLDNRSGGLINASGQLALTQLNSVDNRGGEISSAHGFDLAAQSLDNRGGRLLSDQALGLRIAQTLNNGTGLITSTGLDIDVASLINNQRGQVHSRDRLNARVGGLLDNQSGRVSADSNAQLTLGSLNNSANGQLSSKGDLSLNLNRGHLNNLGGLISTPGKLLLTQLNTVDNQGGEISSVRAFELVADQIDNSAGRLLSEQALNVRIARVLDNAKGLVSAKILDVRAGSLNNQSGTFSAAEGLTLQVDAQVDNRSGKLLGKDLGLVLGTLSNDQGQVQGDSTLNLRTSGAISNQAGLLAAGRNLSVGSASLDNRGGTLTSDATLTARIAGEMFNQAGLVGAGTDLLLAVDSLDNQAQGRITSKTNLTLNAAQLDNRSGRVATVGVLKLNATHLDNRDGGLLSAGKGLDMNVDALDNQGGELSTAGNLSLTGRQLDNSNAGRLLADGDLHLTVMRLKNSLKGSIAAQRQLQLAGRTLDNSTGGSLYAKHQLGMVLAGEVNNTQGSLKSDGLLVLDAAGLSNDRAALASIGEMQINTGTLSNRGGRLSSAANLGVKVTALDNSGGGHVSSQADVSLDLQNGHLNNQSGMINAPGRLVLKHLATVDNQKGEISSAGAFELSAAALNTTDGKVLSQQALTLRIARALDNTRGLISAASVQVNSGSLDNQGGKLNASSDLNLNIDGLLSNRHGELLGQQSILAVGTLDNQQGRIQGDKQLDVSSQGAISNRNGALAAGKLLTINADSLDNSDGKLTSDGALTAQVASAFLNQTGLLAADGALLLKAESLDNQVKGRITGKADVQLVVGKVDNQGGSITSIGQLQVKSDELDNRQAGLLNSGKAMDLAIDQLDNRGGEVSSVTKLNLTGRQLDNSGAGRVLANGTIQLTLDRLNNQLKGLISGQQDVTLKISELNNGAQGNLYAKRNLTHIGSLDNTQGIVRSDVALQLQGVSLINDGGRISSGGPLLLTTDGAISNQNGDVLSAGTSTLAGASVDNTQGRIVADGALQLTTGVLLNQHQGRVTSADRLDLTATTVDNRFKGRIASAQDLKASITGLDQRGAGELYSNSALTLDMNHGVLNNADGLINSPGVLLLKNLSSVDNRNGEISSAQAFTLTANSLDNSGGDLLSDQALSLKLEKALLNVKGLISAAGLELDVTRLDNREGGISSSSDARLTLKEDLLNDQGEIVSKGRTQLTADRLSNAKGQVLGDTSLDLRIKGAVGNQGGTLGAGSLLEVRSASLDNSHAGSLVSNGQLNANIEGVLDNQTQGRVLAKGAMELRTGSLDNREGRLTGQGLLTLHSANVDNRSGTILAQQDLQLNVGQLDNQLGLLSSRSSLGYTGQQLSNQKGLISATGPLRLNADEVQNASGRIASESDLTATVEVLAQQGGELVARGDLSLTATSLDNRNGGLVGATKALTLAIDRVDNQAGEISSQSSVDLRGQRLDNSGGKLLAGTTLELAMTHVINQAKGMVFARDSRFNGARLDNAQGTFAGQQSLNIALTAAPGTELDGRVDNQLGQISSEGALQLVSTTLNNNAGAVSSAADLLLTTSGAITNQAGVVETDGRLDVRSAQLDNGLKGLLNSRGALALKTGVLNNDGRVTSADSLDLTATQVTNTGRIASAKNLMANLAGLDQQGGELFSNTQLNLDVNHGQLNNLGGLINAPLLMLKNLVDVNNQRGEISSQQALILKARNLDNGGGKLISNQGLSLQVDNALGNAKGVISAATVNSDSARLDNSDGLLSSRGRLELSARQLIDNQRGTLTADGSLLLSSAKLDNRGGEVKGKALVSATVDNVDNQEGQLISATALEVHATSLDNRKGLVGATKALKLETGSVDNRGGELASTAELNITGQTLDNSDAGRISAGQALNLTVEKLLNRNQGQLSVQRLMFSGQNLDNSGGKILAQQLLQLELKGELNNTQGLLSSEGRLGVNAASLINREGSVSSAQALELGLTGLVDNQSGQVVTDSTLHLRSASLGNQQGVISGKAAVSIQTGVIDNIKGRLNSGDTLDLQADRLNNGAGSIGSVQALTANVNGLDQQDGKLFSNTRLTLDLNNGQLSNRGGLINAAGPLVLKNLNGVNNAGGEISSAQAFNLAARNLDNSNGRLLSNQGLSLRIDQALSNVKGMIGAASLIANAASVDNSGGTLTSRSNLEVTSAGLLNNQQQGLINATQALTVNTGNLNNQGGSLLGTSALTLKAMALDTSAGGLINSQGRLELTAQSLNASEGGEVSAKGDMDLTLTAMELRRGKLLGDQRLTVDLADGDLDNRGGLIHAKGPLTLNRLRDVQNQGGELSSQSNLSLTGRNLDNSAGKLITNQVLTVNTSGLVNQNGLMSGWQGLNVVGSRLDNRNNGTLSSRNGALDVRLSGGLLNSGAGALVSQGRLGVSAASLDNSDKGIISSGAQQTLGVIGLLNNTQGGLIDSGSTLDLSAADLDNTAGSISAQRNLNLLGGNLINANGTVLGNDHLVLDLRGNLGNVNGKIAGAQSLVVKQAIEIDNRGGQLASQGRTSLTMGGLNNSQSGTVAAKGPLAINASAIVQNNADGLIYSQEGDLQVKAFALTNAQGVLQGQNGLRVEVNGGLDNQRGKIISQTGDLNLKASSVDNRGGVLASLKGDLEAGAVGVLRNGHDLSSSHQGGVIQGQRLLINAGHLDNQGGRISALSGSALLNATALNNQQGTLYAKQLMQVRGGSLDNSTGQIAGNQIELGLNGQLTNRSGLIESASTLSLAADALDNQGGKLRALGLTDKTDFQIGGVFDNRNGIVETANQNLTLAAASFQNNGGQLLHVGEGTFDISLPNVTGAGGTVVTRGGLTLNADTWTNTSVIQAGRLNVNVNNFTQTEAGQLLASKHLEGKGGAWINKGLIASDGSLNLELSGLYGGSGRVSSVGSLGLSAAALNLDATSSIVGGQDSSIRVAGLLTNQGRVSSVGNLAINAGTLNNYGTLGSNDGVRINAQTLLNERGLIVSGGDMSLLADNLTNKYADVYSLGTLTVARDDAGNWANRLDNISGNLESAGDMRLSVADIENKKDFFNVSSTLVSGAIGMRGTSRWGGHMVLLEEYESKVDSDAVSASIASGRNLQIQGRNLQNSASVISASGDINATLENFNNVGAMLGNYSVLKSFDLPDLRQEKYILPYWRSIMAYNAANDPAYTLQGAGPNRAGTMHFWDQNWNESMVAPYTRAGGTAQRHTNLIFGWKSYQVFNVNFPALFPAPSYNAGTRSPLPGAVSGAHFYDERTVSKPGSSGVAEAIVQAGGTVQINATKNLVNSVIREGQPVSVGSGRGFDASRPVASTGVVINVNSQLPPDLAQQQVNPVALPGFSLPTGTNGMFRLSGQASDNAQSARANTGPQSWTMGGASIGLAERQDRQPALQARSFAIDDVTPQSASAQQLDPTARQVSGVSVSGKTLNTAGGSDINNGGTWTPGQIIAGNMAKGDGINALNPSTGLSQPTVVITGPGDQPSSSIVERETQIRIATPSGPQPTQTGQFDPTRPTMSIPGVTPVGQGVQPVVSTNTQNQEIRPTQVATVIAQPLDAGEQTISAGSQTINRVQGVPVTSPASQSHKYLIETNPVLTDLKQFMSSDYLLQRLGYNPDDSWKRLGDGLYEQRLIQQAVQARTGQRFIDGQNTDEKLFKYLMDNAISSKQRLNLAVGVTLTSQQVAALTHDIVWLEQHEVNGEKVLVPVLYLAQADNRLAPNGALIAGNDLNLIAGENLSNAGTLRASNNLSAKAGNDLTNSGLIEAGNRLDLLAGNNIVNKAGGIIAGRDVTLTAVKGDVINDRAVTVGGNGPSGRRDYLDSTSRIEAANDLSIKAGRDVSNVGNVMQSGRDTTIVAGRDVHIDAVEQRNALDLGRQLRTETVTQTGATLESGRDLKVTAGRDFTAIASRVDAKRDVSISVTEDLSISSAANEQHSSSQSKKVTQSKDHISQVSSVLTAGRDVSLSAGKDLELTASRVTGGGNVALEAQRDLSVLSALDEDASFYSKKSKGSFGRSSSKQQESYHSTNVASVVEAGKDLTLNASKKTDGGMNIEGGRDVTVIGSQLKAGGDMLLGATGDIAVLSGVEEHGSYSKKTKSGFLGLSKSGKSQLQTTASQVGSELDAGNDLVVAAGNDVRVRASEISADNDAELRAGLVNNSGDINLISANDTAYSRSEKYEKKTGSISGGFLAITSAKKAGREAQSSTSVGSQVAADRDANLQAERDINLVGSGISAGRDVSLNAGRDVNVLAAQNRTSERDWQKTKQTGIGVSSDANGVTLFVGADKSAEKNRLEQQTAAASQISAGQDLAIKAKRDINQRGADLSAANDVDLRAGRDINIDAARERLLVEQQREKERNGLSLAINHNYGDTKDAVQGAGKGEDSVSKGSSTLKAIDGVAQFTSGATPDGKFGNSSQGTTQQVVEQTNRSSTLSAGNDINLSAGNDVTIKGSELGAGRDINIQGRDVTLDVAKGGVTVENNERQSWSGLHGGVSGGFKVGVGGSHGVASQDHNRESSGATALDAGRNVNLNASNDLSLVGTQVKAGRDIDLKAGNDLNIGASHNSYVKEDTRSSGGGEVGFAAQDGAIGVYASVSLGKGDLEREGVSQQEAYLYAGDRLGFDSARDTNIAGAQLRGDNVVGRVGRDLNVSSVADTGKVKGKEFDVSATVTVGFGFSVSGSVGYGQTSGKTNWIEDQTRITAKDTVDIRTEKHTQLDGALIAADTGKLKLDTATLGFSDIAGEDKEHGYYLNLGGTYSQSGRATQDSSQVSKGKDQANGWSATGWEYDKDREQTVRATVGPGEVVVRDDAKAGTDATAGLNRDTSKGYEITRDDESRTDLYVTSSSIDDVRHPIKTIKQRAVELYNYDKQTQKNWDAASNGMSAVINKVEAALGRKMDAGVLAIGGKDLAENTLEALILSGKSRNAAMDMMKDPGFQDGVLKQLNEIMHVNDADLKAVEAQIKPGLDKYIRQANELPPTNVTERRTAQQETLDFVSNINQYIQANPDKAETVGYVLAVAQGPKGMMQMVVSKAIENTSYGEKLAQKVDELQTRMGKALADQMLGVSEPEDQLNAAKPDDQRLIGGGELLISVLIGAVPGGAKRNERVSVTVKDKPTGGGTERSPEVALGAKGVRAPVVNPTPAQVATAEKLGVDPRWVKSDGSPDWPTKANNGFDGGFDGPPRVAELQPGQTFDRYGGRFDEKGNFTDQGKFVAPKDVPFDQRALPDSSLKSPYQQYEVIKPIPEVNSGNAAPWFGKPGGGTQYQLPMSIDELLKEGFIKPIK
ncbi:hemagglutinin repeat-containing protein [Pseudomonas sp. ICMP 8385]|uniref:hemagglutinin repeat-containing protein n=1 Tax=Pseudomonas sp. ICMP 8385 TaxID=1718920 RepID=UPI00211D1AF0|nr:hemagglutinin repeat-containing protein [Pseudomonas sp. ICMP 8385]